MNKFDPGDNYCAACDKNVIKPCFFLLERSECIKLQEAIENAKRHSEKDEGKDGHADV